MMLIGIEGTALAGKTTLAIQLAAKLSHDVVIVPEFMYFLFPGGRLPPLNPQTTAEQLKAIRFFANINAQRISLATCQAATDTILLIDRTVETLVAHMYGSARWESAFIDECWEAATSFAGEINLDATIHLDAEPATVQARALIDANRPSFFESSDFIERFNEYFRSLRKASWPCKSIGAQAPISTIVEECVQFIEGFREPRFVSECRH
ncbi:hypothetical protein [Rhizobium binxianense]|uniref:hypothetical protein n=1 Tax=Rhizobium binxianense TaxID=3024242 RepID=UPI00234E757E|nr:hypothetical protein [Rhizobium sp. BC56]MDC7745358.1 hypothetical protein [Rhizobium sp. BC56]